tara:strand:- start:125 stop:736 length:612 start_codon:yes stop_codon:yes gene_type:complete
MVPKRYDVVVRTRNGFEKKIFKNQSVIASNILLNKLKFGYDNSFGSQFIIESFKEDDLQHSWLVYCAVKFVEKHISTNWICAIQEAIQCYSEAAKEPRLTTDQRKRLIRMTYDLGSDISYSGGYNIRDKSQTLIERKSNWAVFPGELPSGELFSLGNFLIMIPLMTDSIATSTCDMLSVNLVSKRFETELQPWFEEVRGCTKQ